MAGNLMSTTYDLKQSDWISGYSYQTAASTPSITTGNWLIPNNSITWPNTTDCLYQMEMEHYDKLSKEPRERKIKSNENWTLPDGAKLIVDGKGNYKIEDEDAQVVYKANRIREFSPHLNASDMLAQFMEYVATLGVKQNEVLGLPIELFINWLIIEAAKRDDDDIPESVIPLQKHRRIQEVIKPRCGLCQRFIPRLHYQRNFPFCNPVHAQKHIAQLQS